MLNTASDLEINDKEIIRLRFEELIAKGASADTLKHERAEISKSLQVSVESFRSVTAYPRYCATKAIAQYNLTVERDEFLQVAYNLRSADSETKNRDLEVYAGVLGVNVDGLAAALDTYYLILSEKPEGRINNFLIEDIEDTGLQSDKYTGSIEIPTAPATSTFVMEDREDEIISSGDLANYDFEAKRKWRSAWSEFILKHTNARERERGRVLCTPGRICANEVQHYLDLGYRPENIYAVERSNLVWDEFEANARALGINPLKGDIGGTARGIKVPFDIVNIDWLGGLCDAYLFALQEVPISEKCIVITNTQGAREGSSIQLRMFEDIMRGNPDTYRIVPAKSGEKLDFMLSVQKALINMNEEVLQGFFSDERPEAKELRAKALDQALLNTIGLRRSPLYETITSKLTSRIVNPHMKLKPSIFSDMEEFNNFQLQLVSAMLQMLVESKTLKLCGAKFVDNVAYWSALASDTITARPAVKVMERWSYVSAADSHKTYFSRFAVLEKGESRYKRWFRSAEPLIEIHKPAHLEYQKNLVWNFDNGPVSFTIPMIVTPIDPEVKTKRLEQALQATISCRTLDIRAYDRRFRVDLRHLVQDLSEFKEWHNKSQNLLHNPPPIQHIT